jgi:hypothetical protein
MWSIREGLHSVSLVCCSSSRVATHHCGYSFDLPYNLALGRVILSLKYHFAMPAFAIRRHLFNLVLSQLSFVHVIGWQRVGRQKRCARFPWEETGWETDEDLRMWVCCLLPLLV